MKNESPVGSEENHLGREVFLFFPQSVSKSQNPNQTNLPLLAWITWRRKCCFVQKVNQVDDRARKLKRKSPPIPSRLWACPKMLRANPEPGLGDSLKEG